MVRENHGNRIKQEGDYSIPWETWEHGKSLEDMREQACDEEIGKEVIHTVPTILLAGLPVAGTMATILTAQFQSAVHLRGTAVGTGELKEPGAVWMNPRWFLPDPSGILLSRPPLPTRLGIREILEAFIKRPLF